MFGIPGKPPVTMTPAAEAQIARLMAKGDTKGLRIGVKKGGCAGMEYTMEYVDEIHPHDEVVESNGARVMIAPMAQMFLFGTEIDYADRAASNRASSSTTPTSPRPAAAASRSSSPAVTPGREMAVSAATRAFVLELFDGLGGVSARAMMGGLTLYCDGQVFAIVTGEERIYLKAAGRLAEALAAEGAEQFAYTPPGRRHRPHGLLVAPRRRPRRPRGRLRLGPARARRLVA